MLLLMIAFTTRPLGPRNITLVSRCILYRRLLLPALTLLIYTALLDGISRVPTRPVSADPLELPRFRTVTNRFGLTLSDILLTVWSPFTTPFLLLCPVHLNISPLAPTTPTAPFYTYLATHSLTSHQTTIQSERSRNRPFDRTKKRTCSCIPPFRALIIPP